MGTLVTVAGAQVRAAADRAHAEVDRPSVTRWLVEQEQARERALWASNLRECDSRGWRRAPMSGTRRLALKDATHRITGAP